VGCDSMEQCSTTTTDHIEVIGSLERTEVVAFVSLGLYGVFVTLYLTFLSKLLDRRHVMSRSFNSMFNCPERWAPGFCLSVDARPARHISSLNFYGNESWRFAFACMSFQLLGVQRADKPRKQKQLVAVDT